MVERAGRELKYIQGDRLVVAVENNIPQLSTVHWHGLLIPNAMDGASGLTHAAVDPSGSYVYEFNLLDAGTFWYPHMLKVQKKLAGVCMGH
jgi:FtsP/CotA-like multicopper oxidase with cupredoxin domain